MWGLTRAVRYWGYRVDPDKDDRDYRDDAGRFELHIADTLEGGDVRGLLSPETTELVRTALRAIIGTPRATDRPEHRRSATRTPWVTWPGSSWTPAPAAPAAAAGGRSSRT